MSSFTRLMICLPSSATKGTRRVPLALLSLMEVSCVAMNNCLFENHEWVRSPVHRSSQNKQGCCGTVSLRKRWTSFDALGRSRRAGERPSDRHVPNSFARLPFLSPLPSHSGIVLSLRPHSHHSPGPHHVPAAHRWAPAELLGGEAHPRAAQEGCAGAGVGAVWSVQGAALGGPRWVVLCVRA